MTVDPKIVEVWFKLMADAAKGVQEAQEAVQLLAKVSSPTELNRWLLNFAPGLVSPTAHRQAEIFEEWLEQWWRMMGVVPRARYLELLEKHDALKRQLEKAQGTIRKMQETFARTGEEPYARKTVDLWKAMLDETLKTQTEWIRVWRGASEGEEKSAERVDENKSEKKP
jgi:hypothetical protein